MQNNKKYKILQINKNMLQYNQKDGECIMFEWAQGNAYSMVVTLYPTNFTLNSVAAQRFTDSKYCMLGLDKNNHLVAIKAITKREIDLGLVHLDVLHKISMGKGYARISNKQFIEEVYSLTHDIDECIKYSATFDEKENMLIIDLNHKI